MSDRTLVVVNGQGHEVEYPDGKPDSVNGELSVFREDEEVAVWTIGSWSRWFYRELERVT